jgi:LysM repeat protein
MERRNFGTGVIQHIVLNSKNPAQLILSAWVAGDELYTPPSISADVYYTDGTFSMDHKIVPRKGTYAWEQVHIVIPATKPIKSVVIPLVVDSDGMAWEEALYIDDVELYAKEQETGDPTAMAIQEAGEGSIPAFTPPFCPPKYRCWNKIAYETTTDFLARSEKSSDGKGVTLATQLSTDRLPLLCKSAERWGGPVSAAVYVRQTADLGQLSLWRRKCKAIKSFVTFHLVNEPVNAAEDIPYPVNLLRNVALDAVTTDFVFNVDVDFVPNTGAIQHIMTLNKAMPKVLGEGTNYMLIIPAFEFVSGAQQRDRTPGYEDEDDESSSSSGKVKYLCTGPSTSIAQGDTLGKIAKAYQVTVDALHECNPHLVDTDLEIGDAIRIPKAIKSAALRGETGFNNAQEVPKTKEELLAGIRKYEMQPVHADKFAGAHAITNYEKWYEQAQNRPYQVKFKGVFEPYMVGPRTMPRFDERFAGYGMDKVELNYQLNDAKYMLLVAPGAFVVHHNHPKASWGKKTDLVRVYKNWYSFVYEMDKTYGHGEFFGGDKVTGHQKLTTGR